MKAEEILEATLDSEQSIETIIEAMERYALTQIQKDRSETKRLMNEKLKDFEGLNPDIEAIIDRQITLD
jgi:hypothetical protein